MTAKCSDINFNNAIKDYLTGDSAEVCATRWHTTEQRLSNALKAQGLFRGSAERRAIKGRKISINSGNKIALPSSDIVGRYIAGQSELELASSFGVSRSVIARILRESNILRHSSSEANTFRFQRMTSEQRKEIIKNAHNAIRGKPASHERMCKAAITREISGFTRSETEIMLSNWLSQRGIVTIPQKAVDKYNIDLAIDSILGIEILGGSWHQSKPKHIERTRYILNAGWNMLFIWVYNRSQFQPTIVTNYIITYLDKLSRNPSTACQYRVIRGDGKEFVRGSVNDDNISIVPKGFKGGNIIG